MPSIFILVTLSSKPKHAFIMPFKTSPFQKKIKSFSRFNNNCVIFSVIILMGHHQWGFLAPTEAPSLYTQDQRDNDHWRHFDKSVNAISFGFVATAILISMFLVMAIFERFLRTTTSPVLSPDGGGGGGRNVAGGVGSHMGFNPKLAHSSLKISENAREVSVLMPGEDVPTFIAQPAPVPCPPERIPWSVDPRILYPNITSNSNSQSH